MQTGLMCDLHGTLLNSNEAWLEALASFDPAQRDFYAEQIMQKRSRRELAAIAGVSFEDLSEQYHALVSVRLPVLNIVKKLCDSYSLIIVSNAPRPRVERDLLKLGSLPIARVFTQEDGRKPERDYLERILGEMNWNNAYLIGNDPEEDICDSPRIFSVIFPNKPRSYYARTILPA